VDVDAAEFAFRDLAVRRFTLHAHSGDEHVDITPEIRMPPRRPDIPAQHIQGVLNLDLSTQQISGTLEGRVDLPRLWKALRLPPDKTLGKIRLDGAPADFTATIHPSPFSPKSWRADAAFQVENGWFDNSLHVFRIDADVALRPNHLTLTVNHAEAARAPDVSLGLDIEFHPKRYVLHCRVTGDPRIATPFVGRKGKQHYLNIWKDFSWPQGAYPTSTIRKLVTWRDPKTRKHYTQLEGTMDSGALKIRNLQVDALHADVRLDLPARVVLPKFHLVCNGKPLDGTAAFFLDREKVCRFRVHGVLHPDTVVPAVVPDAGSLFRDVEFSSDTRLDLVGVLPLHRQRNVLEFKGTVDAPEFRWGKLRFH